MATSTIQGKTDSGWQGSNAYFKYRKVNGIVYIHGYGAGDKNIPANGNVTVGTLPAEYRPSEEVNFAAVNRGAASAQPYGKVNTTGTVVLTNGTTGVIGYYAYSVAFPI